MFVATRAHVSALRTFEVVEHLSEEEFRKQAEAEKPIEEPIERKDPDVVLLQREDRQAAFSPRVRAPGPGIGPWSRLTPCSRLRAFCATSEGYALLSFVCGVDCLELSDVSWRFKVDVFASQSRRRSRRLRIEDPLRGRPGAEGAQRLRNMAGREASTRARRTTFGGHRPSRDTPGSSACSRPMEFEGLSPPQGF